MISNRQKKKRFVMRTLVMTLVMTLFTQFAQAQNVYMHSGTMNVPSSGSLNFYDSGGQHSLTGSYFWEKQYSHNENSTLVFKNNNGATKVTFNTFQGWSDTGYPDYTLINLGDPWSARLNDDHLFIYEGEAVDDDKLIADLTGAIKGSFTIMSQGSITFKFVSNGQYRDEGWEATVETVQSFVPQPPIIVKSECSDYVELLSASLGGEYYYTTDGNDPDYNDPLSNATLYTGPFLIDLDATNASVTVKAIVVYEGTAVQLVSSHIFTHNDQRPTPGKPTISISGNTVTFTPAAKPDNAPNESYNIRYTTDGTEPSASNGTLLTKATGFSIEWHTPNITFKAVTLAQKSGCSDIASESETAQFGNVMVPTPTITFDNEGKATIACSLSGATVYYTTDGTQPSQTGPNGIAPVTTNALPIGTTVYAYAGYSGEGYDDSDIISATYVPEGGNGTYGGVVFLDDREDHSWSYYSDSEQPIHSLKPIDVKITYNGYGEKTMTSTSTANMPANNLFTADVNSSQVAVNVGEPGNQFIYMKTLEATNADGTGDYPYTMIANPFQVRPLYNSNAKGETNAITYTPESINNEVRDRNGNIVAYTAGTSGAMTPTASIAQQGGVNRGNRDITADVVSGGTATNEYVPMYTYYSDYGFTSEYIIPASYFATAGLTGGERLTSIKLYQSTTGAWSNVNMTIKLLNTTTNSYSSESFIGNNGTTVYTNSSYSSNSATTHTFTFSSEFEYTGNNLVVQISTGSGGDYARSYWSGVSTSSYQGYCTYGSYGGNAGRQQFIPNTTFTYNLAGPRTITAVAGANISTAYVAEGSTFPAGTTTTTLQVESGNSVTFQATPNSNFAFGGWYDENNNLVSTNATYTCTVTRDLTLTAKGLPTYTVNAVAGENINTAYVAAGSNFSGTETSVTVAEGGSATFQATVNSGYLFAGWYDEQGMKVSSNTTYTVENITGNFTLTAKAKVPHTVTIASTSNGTVTANPTTAGEGSTINLTVTPSSGYAISSITVTGTSGNTYVVSGQGTSYTFTMPNENVTVSAVFFQKTDAAYRGFYAWRVKNMSSGLEIKVGNTTYDSDDIEDGIILYPDQEIQFAAEGDSKDNEVVFEALWARAWVSTGTNAMSSYASNSGNYKNAYERNFYVRGSNNTAFPTHSTHPYTISSYYPDGTGTLRSYTRTSNYSCSTDVKLENTTLSMSNNYLDGNNHSLHIGRGVSNGSSNVAQYVYGNYDPSASDGSFNLRVESGRYRAIRILSGGSTISSAITVNAVFGSDYDRANNETNTNLTVTGYINTGSDANVGPVNVGYGAHCSNADAKINVTALSGTYGQNDEDLEFYMGFQNVGTTNSKAYRKLEVFGGDFLGGIAGGIEYDVTSSTEILKMRIHGGTVSRYMYQSGQYAASYGTRKTIITGGTFTGWIAGGCYGTDQNDSGGVTNGNAYMYFGGDANQTNTTGLFGGGYGSNATGNNKYTVQKSFVVVADDATLAGSVYGGGNNGYATSDTEVWVLGGGEEKLTVSGSVYGGANLSRSGGANTVTMKGGTVNGSVYGGAQGATATTDIVYVTNLATVNIKGGNVKNNVFGGGYGSSTVMRGGTNVTVSGGTIKNNVYGGGEQGTVGRTGNNQSANTSVTISGGSVNDVYGAGLGTEYTGTNWPSGSANANIYGNTTVTVSGGTIANVYGGGENGSVAWNNTTTSATGQSIVTVSGGEITGDVFGGGKNGTTQGTTTVNVSNGIIRGNVFGGAFGAHERIYVTGMRTVNMTGGHVYGNVYGGSHDANDGNNLSTTHASFTNYTGTEKISVTNISGGIIDQNVYAAGYYGRTFGSVYVFIGKDAVEKAPNHTLTTTGNVTILNIGGTVWAGGDWGTFEGSFGGSTISGNSNIYVDGEGYETNTQQISNAQYMNIGGSILGCGTSCHAGKGERTIIIRNYGRANGTEPEEATRTLYSIQFAKVLIFDNSNINFTGQGRINSLNTTEKYAIYEIYDNSKTTNTDTDVDGVRIVNGSGLFLNAPVTQIANFRSMSCEDTFASTALADYTAITPTTLSSCNNQVRVNHGIYVEVKYGSDFGALIGFAHMMASTNDTDATCAYARPKNCYTTQIATNLDNPDDGGWVSYNADLNTFNLDGSDAGTIQMPYENHTTRNGEDYFRIWRVGGTEHYREGVFDAVANGTTTFSTVDVVITLPAFRAKKNYYRFETTGNGENTSIDYGADVLTFNAANTVKPCADGNWMYYDEDNEAQVTGVYENNTNEAFQKALSEIKAKPDVNFGLAILPGQGLNGSNYIICGDADANLAKNTTKFGNQDNTQQPEVTFRLTYYNKLSANMSWDPMTIVLVQCDENGNETDRVIISLVVNTSASIEQEFTTQLYAIMQGEGSTSDTYSAKVVLPMFSLYTAGQESVFTLNSVDFEPANGGNLIARGGTYTYDDYAVEYSPGYNYDNTSGWSSPTVIGTTGDAYPMTQGHAAEVVGYAGGRTEFSIDFKLYYNGNLTATQEELIGTLTFNITFTNYTTGTGANHTQPLTIIVQVYRRGAGTAFYLDGVNGSNSNKGKHPNDAVKSLSTIFNRCGYLAGDVVYVVNKVTANNALSWNGLPYNNVTLYRYNGGHELKKVDGIATPIVDNPNNDSYKGELLVVKNDVTVTGITLDGYYRTGTKGETPESSVTATAPLITVAEGGILELGSGTVLQNNNTGSVNGAAVSVAEGGKLMMNQDATIKNNLTSGDGAGVYMTGTMVVSDKVFIYDNKKGEIQNNVYLNGDDEVITIGTPANNDAYGPLDGEAKIGVTKGVADDYTKVVYVDADEEWLETPYNTHPNSVIFHDLGKYQLEKYSDPLFLYWVGTWVSLQDHVPTDEEGGWPYSASTTQFDINTEYQLAWIISMVNGENGCTADDFTNKTVNITNDIDMKQSIWVPIGTDLHPFKGTFQGNGHVIQGMHSKLVQPNMGMFGNANGATIENTIANVDFEADATNLGTFIGTMTSTNMNNVEAAGILKGGNNTANMGGLVGNVESGTIHSSFAVNTMTAVSDNTVMGGLVGNNSSKLYNSYANVTMTGATNTKIGGLVGVNDGDIQNCYVVVGTQGFPAFAHTNNSSILYSYADKNIYVTESDSDATLKDHGTYGAVLGRKAVGYMYGDNVVTPAVAADTTYIVSVINYEGNRISTWPGLLSSLNQWVAKNSGYTSWNRPTSADINGDLPILAFDNDVCLASTDGKFLDYDTDLDHLLGLYEGQSASMYLYKSVSGVKKGTGTNKLFIQEDAALLQDQGSKAEIKATVGVSFDNSCKKATDWFGNGLDYDWHLMSTPLSDAPLGINYTAGAQTGYGKPADWSEVTENSYMPTMTNSKDGVTWDFYTYYEPEYHWINFKRSKNNHWHYDEPNDNIDYTGAEQPNGNLTKGKGYMMAISQDSYLSNTGTLNTGKVEIALTRSGELPETEEYTKDWGSNLLGNPYQAYLDLEQVATTGYETFYVYIAEEDQYKPYTSGSSKNTYAPSQYLHPHQAFFVLMTEKEEDTFTFTYDMATTSSEEHSYFRKGEHIDYPLINLFVNDEKGARNYTTIEVGRPELGGALKTEALKTTNFDLYARYEKNDYKLLFTPAEAERVAVCFKPEQDGTYTLTWDTQNGEFSFLRLIDNISGVECDMLNNDHYTFEASAYDYASRFYILFNNPNEDDPNNGHNNNGNGFAYNDGYGWIVYGEGILELVDVTGRVLYTEMLHGDMNRVSFDRFTPGVYVLMLGDKSQKIVIK